MSHASIHIAPMPSGRWITGSHGSWSIIDHHLTKQGWPPLVDVPTAVWAGGVGQTPFDAHPDAWLSGGWQQFTSMLTDAPATSHPITLRPHWAHVLSDAPSCRHAWEEHGVQLALSPASMLTADMLPDAPLHLERIFQMCGAGTSVLLLEDLAIDTTTPIPCKAGSGLLPGTLIAHLAQKYVPAEVEWIVLADHQAEASDWLAA